MDTLSEDADWALPQINKIVREIKENEGDIYKIKKGKFFIEIVSHIKNIMRFDQISRDSVVTFSVPKSVEFSFSNLF
jgi:hypothetical protein